jgi:hypothetical protein
MVRLWWLDICTKESIQDEDVQIGSHQVSIAAFANMGILQLVLPTGDDQDLLLLK